MKNYCVLIIASALCLEALYYWLNTPPITTYEDQDRIE